MKRIKILIISLLILWPMNALAYSQYIIPGGENIGIKMESDGIIVVGFYKINGKLNDNNLQLGDRIMRINGQVVQSVNELISTLENETHETVTMTIKRNDKEKDVSFKLINVDGVLKTGLYVKDSLSGIGTITYIDPETKIYGALGHEVVEGTTNSLIDVKEGTIFRSAVSSIDRSVDGTPGSKNARFYPDAVYGDIDKNTNYGIYGDYTDNIDKDTMEVGEPSELKKGLAYINTVIAGEEVKQYKINITKIDLNSKTKNIYFEITDERLLEATGGIVQGMSGSPIIQDGKIYGAVTHVVIENVKKGYGIFITTMLREGESN